MRPRSALSYVLHPHYVDGPAAQSTILPMSDGLVGHVALYLLASPAHLSIVAQQWFAKRQVLPDALAPKAPYSNRLRGVDAAACAESCAQVHRCSEHVMQIPSPVGSQQPTMRVSTSLRGWWVQC